jgi:hypothetical protein
MEPALGIEPASGGAVTRLEAEEGFRRFSLDA